MTTTDHIMNGGAGILIASLFLFLALTVYFAFGPTDMRTCLKASEREVTFTVETPEGATFQTKGTEAVCDNYRVRL